MTHEFEQVLNRNISGREKFLEDLKNLYPSEDVHGLNHALEVERKTIEVLGIACREAKARGKKMKVNLKVLSSAALWHDAGYTAEGKVISSDKFEHQSEGVKIVKKILQKNPFLSQREKAGILMLIMVHDDTAFLYPIKTREGKVCLTPDQIKQRERAVGRLGFLTELKILREADSYFATGERGLERTIEFSSRKGLPFFADSDDPLRAEMWEISIVANLRLSARRAFEDAFTQRGKMLAAVGWLVQEREIFKRCQKEGIDYYPDPSLIGNLLNWHENT
mgnify:CR=1 FL=1